MQIFLRIVHAETRLVVHAQPALLEHGVLGDVLHEVIAEIAQGGSIPGALLIEGVETGGVPLTASCTVDSSGISLDHTLVIDAQVLVPILVVRVAFLGGATTSSERSGLVDALATPLLDVQAITLDQSLDELLQITSDEAQQTKLRRGEPPVLALTYPGWYEGIDQAESLLQAPQQSGDRYAIALALRIEKQLTLKIVWDDHFYFDQAKGLRLPVLKDEKRLRGLMKVRAEELRDFYVECGIEWARISLIQVEDAEASVSRTKTKFTNIRFASAATRIVATEIRNSDFFSFCKNFGIPGLIGGLTTPSKQRVKALMCKHLLPEVGDEKRPVVFLFLRNSGIQPGGAHPELDTYKSIVSQLVMAFSRLGERRPYIYLVGDKLYKNLSYFGRSPPQGKEWTEGVGNLMRWWDPTELWLMSGGERRRVTLCEQLYGFHCLHKQLGSRLVFIGMRSGMLEAPAYMGITTIYMDYKNSGGYERMLVLAGDESGGEFRGNGERAFQGVKIPNYHLLCIAPQDQEARALKLGDTKTTIELLKRVRRLLKGGSMGGSVSLPELRNALFKYGTWQLKPLKTLLAVLDGLQEKELTLKITKEDSELCVRMLEAVNALLGATSPYLSRGDVERLLSLVYGELI
jgi:hypothetical protein